MPYVKIWLHCVWGTKRRKPFLIPAKKMEIINHIRLNAIKHGIYIDFLNGYSEHLHCLLQLPPDKSLSQVMQLIKGESSRWINQNLRLKYRFEWADEYFSMSVSESGISNVRQYIKNQEKHHRKETWEAEYEKLVDIYGFEEHPAVSPDPALQEADQPAPLPHLL